MATNLISHSRGSGTTANYQSAWKSGLAGVVNDRLIRLHV